MSVVPGPTQRWVGYVDQLRDGVRPLIVHDEEAGTLRLVSPIEPTLVLGEGPAPSDATEDWAIPFTADFNGDGTHDFAVVAEPKGPNWDECLTLVDGQTFEPMGSLASTSPRFEAAMDVNGDDTEELVAVDVFHNDKLVLSAWQPSGGELELVTSLEMRPGYLPDDVVQGDFNGDGRRDLAVTWTKGSEPYWLGEPVEILAVLGPNAPGPSLAVSSSAQPIWASSTASADMDGDGDDEIIIARSSAEIAVFDWANGAFVHNDTLAMPAEYVSTLARFAAGTVAFPGVGGMITYARHDGGAGFERPTVALFPSTVSPAFLPMLKVSDSPILADLDGDGFDDVWDPAAGVYVSAWAP